MPDVYRQALEHVDAADLRQLAARFSERYPFLLTSVEHTSGSHDLLLFADESRLSLHFDGRRFFLQGQGAAQAYASGDNFCAALDAWFAANAVNQSDKADDRWVSFIGGWFVYLGYELAAQLEPTLTLPIDTAQPVAVACRSRAALILPHDDHSRATLIAEYPTADLEAQLQDDLQTLHNEHGLNRRADVANRCAQGTVSGTDGEAFIAAVVAAKRAIAEGEIYQANLSREWRAVAGHLTTGALFDALCRSNPSPFAALAHLNDLHIVSSSPERLVQTRNGRVATRPIAGTRPRGADADKDAQLVKELLAHPKERAEHVMLIDLERNDLGRICAPGSVQVDEYMSVESYRHVHHIVSNVVGELTEGTTPGAVIAAVFPGGTITGCPKVRCMQLIADLEQRPRGAYTGSLGYLSRNGNMDLNILIRSMWLTQGDVRFAAGAGIVADSDPQAELREAQAKARGMLLAYETADTCAG